MKRFVSLFLFPAVLLLAGCDLPSGTDPEPDSSGTITAADLVGTWEQVNNFGDYTEMEQYIFYDDGTYVVLEDDCQYNSPNAFYPHGFYLHHYNAKKGTYSLDTKDNLTMTAKYHAEDIESFDVPVESDWIAYEYTETTTSPVLIIMENQLYIGNNIYNGYIMIAQGNVSGIVGTWNLEQKITQWDVYYNDGYYTIYGKFVYKFNPDNTYKFEEYVGRTETYEAPYQIVTGTYAYDNETLTITPADGDQAGQSQSFKVIIYNNYLIFGDETSATAYAYIKQP